MKTISTASAAGIVQRGLQVVIPEEPIEGRPCLSQPTVICRGTIGFQTSRDGCASFDRLLIKASLVARLTVETERANRNKVAVHAATLLGYKPLEGLQTGGQPLFGGGPSARQQQCLRQVCVAICQTLFKPVPSWRVSNFVDVQQLAGKGVSLALRRPVSGKAIKVLLDSKQREGPCARTGEPRHRGKSEFKQTPGEPSQIFIHHLIHCA